ncbi:hypothetical protein MRX96_055404 [Rhipicephalus microplus]
MPLSTCTAPGRGTHWYLREFLNTTEGIWTYASTSTRTVTCEVNKMKYISTSEIIYQRKFLWGEKRCEVDLQGQFFRSYDDRMTVQSPCDIGYKQLWKLEWAGLDISRFGTCDQFRLLWPVQIVHGIYYSWAMTSDEVWRVSVVCRYIVKLGSLSRRQATGW